MKYYSGSKADDALVGGGSYNRDAIGSEVCNFKSVHGKLYGYFEPATRQPDPYGALSLARIVPGTVGQILDHVLVIFVATDIGADPGERQVIVGWYSDATVMRVCKDDPTGQRWCADRSGNDEVCLYNVVAHTTRAVLLPTFRRKQGVPQGEKGGMGQANVRYPYSDNGELRAPDWMWKAISFVESYHAENWLTDPLAGMPQLAEFEREIAAGYESNANIRRAVEERGMFVVRQHYLRDGFEVVDKHKTEPFEFLCTKAGVEVRVEVKGTRTNGAAISLTPNEVQLASDKRVDLCVVHSIQMTEGKKIKATGGTLVRYEDWNPRDHDLRTVHFECRLLKRLAATR